jgi:hypothetical protein
MARRAGKAASRKARQRRVQRPGTVPPQPSAPPSSVEETEAAASVAATPARRNLPPRPAIGSALTVNERSEYHYVERDLLGIAILSVVMAVLLGLSYFVVRALDIVP